MKSTNSVSARSLCADRHSFSRTVWTLLMAMLSLCSALSGRAAQEVFWPFNSFPPPAWRFASDSGQQVAFPVLGGGVVLARNFVITNLSNPIILPPLGDSATNDANVRVDCELSQDFGMSWQPYSGNGDMSLVLSHTNDGSGVRMFGMEISGLNIVLGGPPGPGGGPNLVRMRESPFQASLGQLIVSATNGGFFLSSFADLLLEREGPFFGQWTPGNLPAHVELSGPPGVPAVLSVSRLNATDAKICWSTQTDGQYQLQRKNSVAGGTWTDVGAALAGTSSNVCVIEAIDPGTNQFYRVQLSP
jgi:hypothetical protein